jgi:hypothetical protein
MTLVRDTLDYLGRSFWGLPNKSKELQDSLSRGRLYHGWGEKSGELNDFENSFENMNSVSELQLGTLEDLERCEILLENILSILKLRLKSASEDFVFLCDHRMRIELRDLDFKTELHQKVVEFMDYEERYLVESENVKQMLMSLELEDEEKHHRQELLEAFEKGLQDVCDAVESFYKRVKDYIAKG